MLYLSRRNFITIGSAVLGSSYINLPKIIQAQENTGKHKALINIFLAGGPPHLDLWDLKPDAPQEIRGAFNPIKTNVNGIEI